jgi:CBS domain containing-hemolysin-like protein
MTGVIAMEDILEEIVGREIMDESDKAKNMRELARRQYKETSEIDKDLHTKDMPS